MKKEPNWEDFGLTYETLFDPSVSMNFWRQYPSDEFLKVMVTELKSHVSKIDLILDILEENEEFTKDKDSTNWIVGLRESKSSILAITNICMYYAQLEDNAE